jgi:hypothetical protein
VREVFSFDTVATYSPEIASLAGCPSRRLPSVGHRTSASPDIDHELACQRLFDSYQSFSEQFAFFFSVQSCQLQACPGSRRISGPVWPTQPARRARLASTDAQRW